MDNVKLKIDLMNGLVELEGNQEFAKTELPKILGLLESTLHRSDPKKKNNGDGKDPAKGDEHKGAEADTKADLGEFLAKAKPETNNEIVATVAYFWAFIDKAHGSEFKNKEIVDLYTGPIRRSKPSRASNLCSDCATQEKWVRAGSKLGYWQISDEGQKFVEGKMKSKS